MYRIFIISERILKNTPFPFFFVIITFDYVFYMSIFARQYKKAADFSAAFPGTLEGIRTPDPLVRSQILYPAELQAHILFCRRLPTAYI